MRVIVFCGHYPPFIGGLESHADQFNKYLSRRGSKITVFTSRLPVETEEDEVIHDGIRVIRFPAFEPVKNYPIPKFWSLKFWKQYRSLKEENFDLILSRTRFFSTSFLAMIFSKRRKIKWVHIEHGSDFTQHNWFVSTVERYYDYTIGRLILRSSDLNVAISEAAKVFLEKLSKRRGTVVVHRGIEQSKILEVKPNLELKSRYKGRPIVTFVGRLIDGKGIADLIKACAKVKQDFVLLVIGDGSQEEYLRKLVRDLRLEDRVKFLGAKENLKVISIMKVTDLFVNPSHTEGLPTTVIEAALSKAPIIATDVGGTTEVVENGKSALIIKPKRPSIIAKAMVEMLNNQEMRKRYADKAFEDVRRKFNWERAAEKYDDLFREVLNS